MAKNSITDYDNIAANNTDIQSVDIDEGCAPSGINNAIRELMADLADVNDGTVPLASPDINGGTIDGVTIGGTTAGAGTFTTGTFSGNLIVDTNTLFVDSANNRVGIGTSSPSYAIDTLSSGAIVAQFKRDASGGGSGGIRFGNNDKQFTLYGDNSNGLTIYDGSTERMRIDSSGNVGIGTSSPACGLHIDNPDNGAITAILDTDNSSVKLVFRNTTETGNNIQIGADGSNLVALTGATERMRIDSSGNVGIGTSSPSYAIDTLSSGAIVAQFKRDASGGGSGGIRFGNNDKQFTLYGDNSNGLTIYDGSTERARLDASGNLLVGGTAIPAASSGAFVALRGGDNNCIETRRVGTGGRSHHIFYNANGVVGSIQTSGSSTLYNTSSDYRLKEDMQPMTGAIERVNALNPVNFAWKADGSRVDGFLAHEAQSVVPEAVTGTKDAMQDEEYEVTPAVLNENGNVVTEAVMGTRSVPDYQGIDQSKLVPLLTAALQEAIAKIETLETKVAALENA
jgi:hypothetical protein